MQQKHGLGAALGGVIAMLVIGISLLFQGMEWCGGVDIKILGSLALAFGAIFVAVGIGALVFLSCCRDKKR